ncbi:MAG: cobalt ECF transporter T component CbiQ [Defluviicoccus sp.]
MDLIDRIAQTNRWSQRHPGEKLMLGGGLLLLSVILPAIPAAPLILLAAVAAVLVGARVSVRDYMAVFAAPFTFLALGAFVLAVSVEPDAGAPWLAVSSKSATIAAAVTLRALAATASLLLIVLTVPLTALLRQAHRLHVPAPIIEIAVMMYRLVMLAFGMAARGQQAQANRLGYRDVRRAIHSSGLLAAALLPRLLERGRRMEIGLATRACTGELRTLAPAVPLSSAFLRCTVALHVSIAMTTIAWIALVPLPA